MLTKIKGHDIDAASSSISVGSLSRADEDWHEIGTDGEPAFENSWDNVGGNYNTCAFRFDAEGKVWYKGQAGGGTPNTTIYTLPVAYRSSKTQIFAIAIESGYGQLTIGIDGTVKLIV